MFALVSNLHQNNSMDDYGSLIKLMLIGPAKSGKSQLLSRFVGNYFTDQYRPTIGIEFQTQNISLERGKSVLLQLWDTGGQVSSFSSYFRHVRGILVAFDLHSAESFQRVDTFLSLVVDQPAQSGPVVLVVGCKSDLPREVAYEEAADEAKRHDAAYVETSALNSDGVEEAFGELVEEIVYGENRPQREREREETAIMIEKWTGGINRAAEMLGERVASLVGEVRKALGESL